jgi:hypothetical protein
MPPPRLARRLAVVAVVAGLALLAPLAARGPHPAPELPPAASALVAEALFLCDPLPPGGRDLNLSVAVERSDPDPATNASRLVATPRVQVAMALGERLGLTADVGVDGADGVRLHAPNASLKLLLRAPDADRAGVAASLDVFGPDHAMGETAAGLGLGVILPIRDVALRASASVASAVSSWSPQLHGGLSAALALGARWRALLEVVAEGSFYALALSAGPALKVQLAQGTALTAGTLFAVAGGSSAPSFMFQLTQAM